MANQFYFITFISSSQSSPSEQLSVSIMFITHMSRAPSYDHINHIYYYTGHLIIYIVVPFEFLTLLFNSLGFPDCRIVVSQQRR